jgi:hypothetical protein
VEDELKREAVTLLKQMGATEPYIAYMDDNIVEIKVDGMDKNSTIELPQVFHDVIDMTVEKMKGRYEEGFEAKVRELWNNYISAVLPLNLPKIKKPEAWAAALELYYCLIEHISIDKMELAHHYGAAYSTLLNNFKRIGFTLLEHEYNRVRPYLH